MEKAEVTAFLSVIFILIISFMGGILESASIQVAKNYRRADVNRAIECLFAEYQKELLEEYDVFAFDVSYGGGGFSEETVSDRLAFYGVENSQHSIERIKLLSDAGGLSGQANYYMEHKYGLDYLKEKTGMTAIWNQKEKEADRLKKEDIKMQENLEQLLQENEAELPPQNNPIAYVTNLKKSPLLELVMPNGRQVSQKNLSLAETVSHRQKNQGYGEFSEESGELLFGEYLLEHFSSAADEGGNVLDYEVEYLIAGESSDRENLERVLNKLVWMRFVPNYAFLQSSPGKKAEAEALALTLCSLITVPAISTAAAQGILLAWAYGEAIMDIRTLLNGRKVPFIKNESSWQLSLTGLMKLNETGLETEGADAANGLKYEEYLRMLLFLEEKETLELRALDLIEQNLQKIHGIYNFQADACVTKMELQSICKFRRNITYQFSTYFAYQ